MSSLPETLVRFRGELEEAIGREHADRRRRRRRRFVGLVAAALVVVVGTAAAFGTVRDAFFGTARCVWGTQPSWSPDGRRISFVAYSCRPSHSSAETYVMNADGSGRRKLPREWASPSPDWRRVAFTRKWGVRHRFRNGVVVRYSDIWVMDAHGRGLRRLTRGGISDGPVWSPDGRRIAFLKNHSLPPGDHEKLKGADRAEIYVVNADGSGLRKVTRHRQVYPGSPVWSPDGTRIAFGSGHEIYVVNVDGSGLRNLTAGPGGAQWDPTWSPDGRKLAFKSLRDGNAEIYVVSADGSGLRRLTHSPDYTDVGPVWSPDGRRILFVRAEYRTGNSEILIMNADGSGQRNLTRHPSEDASPAWSPDSRRIVFVSKRDGHAEIYVMNADGSRLRRLTGLKDK
jgi:TolB protein